MVHMFIYIYIYVNVMAVSMPRIRLLPSYWGLLFQAAPILELCARDKPTQVG